MCTITNAVDNGPSDIGKEDYYFWPTIFKDKISVNNEIYKILVPKSLKL